METNYLRKFEMYATEFTDAPAEFHTFMAIATCGIILGRNRWVEFGETKLYPNFWIILLAPSSFFRKSTALNIASRCIYNINNSALYPSEFSHEKILEIIQHNPCGVFFYYEFKTLMGLLSKDYMAGTKAFLTEIFDNPEDYKRITKGGTIDIQKPCISIVSGTTADWFVNSIRSGDIEGGFLGRFIYVWAKKKTKDEAIPKKADPFKRNIVYNTLTDIYNYVKTNPAEMTISDEAKKIYCNFYKRFVHTYENTNLSYRTLLARLNIYCIKLAMVYQVCSDIKSLIISEKTMEEAIITTNFILKGVIELCDVELAFNKSESQEKKVMKVLREYREISRSELLRISHLSSKEFNEVLRSLIEKEYLIIENKKEEGSNRTGMFLRARE